MLRKFFLAGCLIFCCLPTPLAKNNELSFTVGGGTFSDHDRTIGASALSVAYTRRLFAGLAVEGSLDTFFVNVPGYGADDYGAAQVAVLYRFGAISKNRRLVPYLAAGVGSVSTDVTEIRSDPIYRLSAGAEYYFSKEYPWGLRAEVRDEITRRGHQPYPLKGNRLSVVTFRAGITYRF